MPPTGSPAQPSAAEADCSDDMPSTASAASTVRLAAPSSRSVEFRVEIGSLPRRDRSSSASRSVHFRAEIGRVGDDMDAGTHTGQRACTSS